MSSSDIETMSVFHLETDERLLELLVTETDPNIIGLLRDTLCDRVAPIMKQAIRRHSRPTSLPAYKSDEDLLQDSYVALIAKLATVRAVPVGEGIRNIRAYAYNIAKHECNAVYRREKSKFVHGAPVSLELSPDLPVDQSPLPDQRLILKEELSWRLRQLEKLPEDQRRAYMLSMRHDKTRLGTLDLFTEVDLCSPSRLASLVGLTVKQFAELQFPLTDSAIAVLMAKSESEVSKLRESAGRRLKRRKRLRDVVKFHKK